MVADSLTRAALLYADGKATDGRRDLLHGLDANADKPQELQQFAEYLEKIGSTNAGGAYRSRPNLDYATPAVVPAKSELIGTSPLQHGFPSTSGGEPVAPSS